MKVLFRVDSFPEVGMGHIVRSIGIANNLQAQDKTIELVFLGVYDKTANLLFKQNNLAFINDDELINNEENIFIERVKKKSTDVIFIDKLYNYSKDFIISLRNVSKVIMYHNLCDGAFFVNKFILPSAHTNQYIIDDERWNNGIVDFYWGPKYIAINDTIKDIKRFENKTKKKIVIVTGGSDPKGVLIILSQMLLDNKLTNSDIVLLKGKSFMHVSELSQISNKFPENMRVSDFDSQCFSNADIAISTFGVSTYELIYLNIPTISLGHVKSNALGSSVLAKKHKAIIDIGLVDNLTKDTLLEAIDSLLNDSKLRSPLNLSLII